MRKVPVSLCRQNVRLIPDSQLQSQLNAIYVDISHYVCLLLIMVNHSLYLMLLVHLIQPIFTSMTLRIINNYLQLCFIGIFVSHLRRISL